ncbi:MAG: thiamine phosphate synthase [Clostridia bacterium]|nr:thiamine phosphate synthase [Clostridia bacterium]
MKSVKDAMMLYAVTDRAWTQEKNLISQVEESLKGGATCIQLREKDLDEASFLEEANAIRDLCNNYGVLFIVNDNISIAIKSKADGIHIGQHDMNATNVRKIIGNSMIMGVSVQTVEQALKAEADGADYLGVGAVFPTSTKDDADSVDYDTLKDICSAVSIPVVAIGGICYDNMHLLCGSGIDGVAVVSAIFAQKDITAATEKLLTKARESFL